MFNINPISFFKSLFKKDTIFDTGLIPSPLDYNDIPMEAVSTLENPTPESYKIPYKLTMKNQLSTPKCVAYTGSTIKEYFERKEGQSIEFDPDWLYAKCKEIDGIPNVQGTYFRVMLKVLKNVGCKPVGGMESDAAKYRIGGYLQVPCNIESVKRSIYEFGTTLLGFYLGAGSWNTAYVKNIKPTVAAHATTGIGFDANYVQGQNSFGAGWGDNGYFYFNESYLPFESWSVLVDLPNNWQDLLPDKNAKPKYVFNTDLFITLNHPDVKVLQDCLKYIGCMDKSQESTGYFGTITQNAVKVLQARYNIQGTGRVGPITRAKLNELFA